MKIKKFEDIVAWQKAQNLTVIIYSIFGKQRDYGFRDQICRASVSISSNIAEGFERSSKADFARFLNISLGSCSELKSLLYLAEKLNYLENEKSKNLILQVTEISRIIQGLVKYLKTSGTTK